MLCPLEDDGLPERMAVQAAVAADLAADYLFASAGGGGMSLAEAGERLRRLGDAAGEHEVYLAL